jgi:hypothetical protein
MFYRGSLGIFRQKEILKKDLKETEIFFGEIKLIPIFALPKTSRVRLRARTPPFHGGDTGSNPVRGTKVSTLAKLKGLF